MLARVCYFCMHLLLKMVVLYERYNTVSARFACILFNACFTINLNGARVYK